jgi:hypothetical protein
MLRERIGNISASAQIFSSHSANRVLKRESKYLDHWTDRPSLCPRQSAHYLQSGYDRVCLSKCPSLVIRVAEIMMRTPTTRINSAVSGQELAPAERKRPPGSAQRSQAKRGCDYHTNNSNIMCRTRSGSKSANSPTAIPAASPRTRPPGLLRVGGMPGVRQTRSITSANIGLGLLKDVLRDHPCQLRRKWFKYMEGKKLDSPRVARS